MTEYEREMRKVAVLEEIEKLNKRLYEIMQRYQGDPPAEMCVTLEIIHDALAVGYRKIAELSPVIDTWESL